MGGLFKFFIAVLFVYLVVPSFPVQAEDDIVQGQEQEVERFNLGHRGMLSFTNEINDVIQGESLARIYLTKPGRDEAHVLVEHPGEIIERALYRDFDKDGLKEIAVLWRRPGQAQFGLFEIYEVGVGGRLTKIFPGPDAARAPLPFLDLLVDADLSKAPPGTAFGLSFALCELTRRPPLLHKVEYYGAEAGRVSLLGEHTEEAVLPQQKLNLAFELYRCRRYREGLLKARNTLESIRLSGPADLMGDAYSAVAKGYRCLGDKTLADAFQRRARLRYSMDGRH